MSELVCKLQVFVEENHLERQRRRGPPPLLSLAHLMAICMVRSHFGLAHWKELFQNPLIQKGWIALGGFPLGSYSGFMRRLREVGEPLDRWIQAQSQPLVGLGAIDSTLIPLGKPWLRWDTQKYKALRRQGAAVGHGSTGVCFGAKLTVAINDQGQIHAHALHAANTHDLHPVKSGLLDQAIGIVLADSGYISQVEAKRLAGRSLALWARPPAHHQAAFTPVQARVYRYREVVEGVFAKLKQSFSLVPRWPPRTFSTARAYILGALAAYILDPAKPAMKGWLQAFKSGVKT